MSAADDRWVHKVHPLERTVAPEDPMELMAQGVAGDPETMLQCILQEFIWMGWNADQLMGLFSSPAYPMLYQLRESYGEPLLRRRVEELLARSGVLQFRATVTEDEELDDQIEPELVQITLPPCGTEQPRSAN